VFLGRLVALGFQKFSKSERWRQFLIERLKTKDCNNLICLEEEENKNIIILQLLSGDEEDTVFMRV
jgi:hypothetical protein